MSPVFCKSTRNDPSSDVCAGRQNTFTVDPHAPTLGIWLNFTKVCWGSPEKIANASGMSVVPIVSRHSGYFANVPLPDLAHPLDRMWSVATFDAIAHGFGGVSLLSCGPGPLRRMTESCVRRDGHGCHAAIIRWRLQELAADLDSGWIGPDPAPTSGAGCRRLTEIIDAQPKRSLHEPSVPKPSEPC